MIRAALLLSMRLRICISASGSKVSPLTTGTQDPVTDTCLQVHDAQALAVLSFGTTADSTPIIVCALEALLERAPRLKQLMGESEGNEIDLRSGNEPRQTDIDFQPGLLVQADLSSRWMWLALLADSESRSLDCECLNDALELREFAKVVGCWALSDAVDARYKLRDSRVFGELIRKHRNDR